MTNNEKLFNEYKLIITKMIELTTRYVPNTSFDLEFDYLNDILRIKLNEVEILIDVSDHPMAPQTVNVRKGKKIELKESNIFTYKNIVFQLGHELVHALYGECDLKTTTLFEEGFATWNSLKLMEVIENRKTRNEYQTKWLGNYEEYYIAFNNLISRHSNKELFFINLKFNSNSNFDVSKYRLSEHIKMQLDRKVYI